MPGAKVRSTGECGRSATSAPSDGDRRANAASVETSARCSLRAQSVLSSKPRHSSCSYVRFVTDVFSALAQIVSHTSTHLVAKAPALEARDQDLDRNLDSLPGRHRGGRYGIDEFVPRAIDERADRGTG